MFDKRVSSFDVAKLAGVSQPTVSRAFAPDAYIAPETRQRVLEAAQKLGYKPNALARSLTQQSSQIVGVVLGDMTTPFYTYVLQVLTRRWQELERRVMLFSIGKDESADEAVRQLLEFRVEGIVLASTKITAVVADECYQNGTPLVLFNRFTPGIRANGIACDNSEGGRLVANLLLDAGHQRLAFIGGSPDTRASQQREKGFQDRLQERGMESCAVQRGEHTYESGFQAAVALMNQNPRPDGIFCANDIMAIGAMDAIRYQFGLKIPQEVSVIGFDDIPAASWPAYGLTTVRQPVEQMVEAVIEQILSGVSSEFPLGMLTLIAGELVRRGSARLP
jgi:DNA-binding LacI/PurR family transcriptional regulator